LAAVALPTYHIFAAKAAYCRRDAASFGAKLVRKLRSVSDATEFSVWYI
jgi:hypothetical protein